MVGVEHLMGQTLLSYSKLTYIHLWSRHLSNHAQHHHVQL